MKKRLLYLFYIVFLSLSSYGQAIPIIEVRINNSETSKDDYINTLEYVPCTIRLFNGINFSDNIPVTLRNIPFGSGGQVLLSSVGGLSTGSTSLDLDVNRDNSFTTFFVKGRTGFNSKIDKDAIIEVIDNRYTQDGTVLARKGMMVVSATPLPITTPQIELQINSVSTLDDYVTWSPAPCRIRLANYTSFSSPVSVTLRNMSGSVGRVNFASSTLSTNNTATSSTINLSLSHTGTWVNFYIAGRFNSASRKDKDAIIEVINAGTSTVYTREPLMVRVRRNANNLSIEERQRFLNALVTLNNTFNGYATFLDIHTSAGSPEAHNGSGFLPWHRAFILNLERKLQTIDPGVSIPYWKFDQSASNVFSLDFMGSKPSSGDAFANFNSSDPLIAWDVAGGPGIRRTTAFSNSGTPSNIRSESATLALGTSYSLFRAMESNPHGSAHTAGGSLSGDWLRSIFTAVRDPLFFLLHVNVDRLWAKWQWVNSRFDAQSSQTYSPQGSFPGSGTIHIGHYLNDTMWPWNGITGTYTGSGTISMSNRPTTAPGGPVPAALSVSSPVNTPRPYNMIDYQNNRLLTSTNSGMGFCYDDTPFQ